MKPQTGLGAREKRREKVEYLKGKKGNIRKNVPRNFVFDYINNTQVTKEARARKNCGCDNFRVFDVVALLLLWSGKAESPDIPVGAGGMGATGTS